MAYAELLARSNFSLLHGASHPEELVEMGAALGLTHIGLVDRDAVYGLPRLYAEARHHAIAPVCGATLTIEGHPPVSVLVETRQGWTNLTNLLTRARADTVKGYAALELTDLLERAAGLTCVPWTGWTAEGAGPLLDVFGERFEVPVTRRMVPSDRRRVAWAVELSGALGRPLLATNAPLMHVRERRRVADVLTAIRRLVPLAAVGRALEPNAERYLLSEAEMRSRYTDFPQAVDRTLAVAERCAFSLAELDYTYPREVVPEGWTPMSWLEHLVAAGLQHRYPEGVPPEVEGQVDHELGIIERLGFPSYFLTVYDIVRFARERGILCQGRGSAANSAVCYVLGITAVDPSRSNLLFERFISEERGEPPDIDVDFEHERREEVIQYVYERYGRHRAALVNEVICYRLRSAVRDVGKVFGLSLDQVDRLAKCTDRWSAGDGAEPDDLVREAGLDPADPGVRNTLAVADEMRGFPRHLGIHVGGFTISDTPLVDLVPIEPATMDDRTVMQWDKYDVEALGFVKVDVLGLGMLTAIRRSFDFIRQHWGLSYDLATVPAEDPTVYDMFCRSDTVGVFQIESRGQMSMLARLKPRCFYDLVIEVAIFRPGPIQGGMVHPYLRRRQGKEPVSYAHPDLEPILARTLGVPLFQEQAMEMAVAVAGFTPGQADALRRAMGKWRKKGTLGELGDKLVQGMIDRGIQPEYADAIHRQLQGFGEYGFPESHSASFALLVYVSGWIKCHYPEVFCAALINSQPMGFYSPRSLVADAQRHGVEARPISVAHSDWDCTLEPTDRGGYAIRLGLRLIKGFGEDDAECLVGARRARPFADVADLAWRTRLDRGALQQLAESGAMEVLGVDRRRAAWELQGLWTGLPLLAGLSRNEPDPGLPVETPVDRVRAEYRTVGLSVDRHPVALLRGQLEGTGTMRIEDLLRLGSGARGRVVGLVSNRQRPGTANGVVFMTLEDETAMLNLVVWPRVWAENRRLARDAVIVGVDGELQRQDDAVSFLADSFWAVRDAPHLPKLSRDFR